MVISVLLLICVCARSDYRPDPWETERVWDQRPPDFQCYCVSAVVSLYPAALQPRLFISLALTGIVLKLAVKELIKQPLCLGWTNAPLYRLKLAVKSKSHRHQPNNTHSRQPSVPCSGYYTTDKPLTYMILLKRACCPCVVLQAECLSCSFPCNTKHQKRLESTIKCI